MGTRPLPREELISLFSCFLPTFPHPLLNPICSASPCLTPSLNIQQSQLWRGHSLLGQADHPWQTRIPAQITRLPATGTPSWGNRGHWKKSQFLAFKKLGRGELQFSFMEVSDVSFEMLTTSIPFFGTHMIHFYCVAGSFSRSLDLGEGGMDRQRWLRYRLAGQPSKQGASRTLHQSTLFLSFLSEGGTWVVSVVMVNGTGKELLCLFPLGSEH